MNLTQNAENLIELIEGAGYEAYAVGGCVRDSLLGNTGGDTDLTSSATPFELEEILNKNGIRYIETGLKHGTITVLFDGEPIEVTTFRTDGEYFDCRHPESVSFVRELSEDLSRRDFTINAMAYNKIRGLVDLFGGQEDLQKGIIKTVGDPDKRFNEDALRIMRAIRFASVLGFKLEEETKKSVFRNMELLSNVSPERLFTELKKLLMGDYVWEVLMEYRDVIAVIIPEIKPTFDFPQNSKWHLFDVWEHICYTVKNSPKDEIIRLTMLFHDIGKPFCKTTDANGQDHFYGHPKVSADFTAKALKRLRVSNEIFDNVVTLVEYHDIKLRADKKMIKKWLARLGYDTIKQLVIVKRADMYSQNTDLTARELPVIDCIEETVDGIFKNDEAVTVKNLALNGYDLIELGLEGREIGEALAKLLDLVIDEEISNNKECLIKYVKDNRADFE